MSDQSNFNPPTIISLDIPDVVSDTLASIDADEARISAARTKNTATLAQLTTLLSQIQGLITLTNEVAASIDSDEAKVTALKASPTLAAAQTTTTPPTDTAPTITSITTTTPDGTLSAGQSVSLSVTFDKAVTVDTTGGTPSLTLSSGGTATYKDQSVAATVLDFDYSINSGDTTNGNPLTVTSFNLNGGTVKESTGADASLTLPATTTLGNVIISG